MFVRMRKVWLAVLAALGVAVGLGGSLIGCASMWSPLPTADELASLGAMQQDNHYDSMRRGRALVVTQCANCHRFFWPHEYPSRAWPKLLKEMGSKASLTRRQIGDMTRYMVAAAKLTGDSHDTSDWLAALDAKADPDALQRGQSLAATVCAECHRFYAPREYSPNEWPDIVQSMGELAGLSDSEILDIARYYVAQSRERR